MLLSDMQSKDIINVKDGNNLGRIIDAKIDITGKIVYFAVEEKKFIRKVTRSGDTTFSFEQIKKIGEDVILVDLWYNLFVIFMKKKTILFCLIFLVLDIVSKIIVNNNMELYDSLTIIPNFFAITKVYNTGVSFSMLSGQQLFIILLSIIIFIVLIIYQKRFKNSLRIAITFGLIYGGIIGNLINRIFLGYVIDFLDFKIINYDYPVFNLADTFIVIGVLLLILAIYKKEDENVISSK